MEKKILKHGLSSEGVISLNQRCRQRNKYLRGLNEDKERKVKKETQVRKETMQPYTVSPVKTFKNRLQYFVIE